MNGLSLINGPCCYLELRQGTLQVALGERGLELPLERNADGRLTESCKNQLAVKLPEFLKCAPWQSPLRGICAIGARGVTLRKLSLPATSREDLQRVLVLQVEAEFPLSPDELAWGYQALGEVRKANGDGAHQDVLVAAIRQEAVATYAELLRRCNITPLFTIAALARTRLCPQPPAAYSVLDVGRHSSELVCFENGVPTSLRLLPWGGEAITRALAERLQLGRNEAETFKLKLEKQPWPNGEVGPKIETAVEEAVAALADALQGHNLGRKLFLTGKSTRQKDLAARLARKLGPGVECQAVEVAPVAGRTAAVLGLQQSSVEGVPPLLLDSKPTNGHAVIARPKPWKWVGIAAALLFGLLLLPYAEAFLFKPHLASKVAGVKRDAARLPVIDQELNFLEYLKQSQPPYLDTLYVFAKAAPQGARLESLNMNRRGELSWRGTLKDSQQVADFRSKLIDSGMFGNVTVEEQTPSQDHQKLSVRMSAQWKAPSAKQMAALGPTPEEIEKARTNVHQPTFGAPMMPGGFPGMEGGPPPGMMMPPRRSSRSMTPPGNPGMATPMNPGGPAPGASGVPMPNQPGQILPPGLNPSAGGNP